jgi:hypothetical protein
MDSLNTAHTIMPIDDMFSIINKEINNNWGVVGYDPHKEYFDYKKQKLDRETLNLHQAVWAKKQHYPPAKLPKDENGKVILPKRENFIDETIKMYNSNFSKKKFDEYVEALKDKGKTLEEVEGIKRPHEILNKDKAKAKIYKHDRNTYIDEIVNEENKKKKITPEFEEIISKAKEKQSRYASPPMTDVERMIKKYKGKGASTYNIINILMYSKSDRVTFLAEAIYCGEKTPFYYTKPEEDEEGGDKSENEKKNKNKKLFFPDKNVVLEKSPRWKFHVPGKTDKSYAERREEQFQSKVEDVRKSWDNRRIKFIDDVATSYFKLHDGKKGSFKYQKVIILIIFLILLILGYCKMRTIYPL